MIRFFAPDINIDNTFPEKESAHAVRVLRHRAGDIVEAVDGKGHLYRCRLLNDNPKGVTVAIEERIELPKVWSPRITLAVAPTKMMDRMEWLLEKAVEIGIDRFTPLLCSRSERKDIKLERLEKIAVSAMKQSLKAVLPQIDPLTPFKKLVETDTNESRFIAWCDDDSPRSLLAKTYQPGSDVSILIGPEGDFTPDEVAMATAHNYVPVTLGDNRLRTETAAIVGIDTVHILNQAAS